MSTEIRVITTCSEMVEHVRRLKSAGKSIGVVPTMGALHAGHLSLVEPANESTDETIVTIFVNPIQFAPGEDLEKYPQTFDSDLEKLIRLDVPTVFAPTTEEMYPQPCMTRVIPAEMAVPMESEFRPTHFGGVATVVLKLLNLTGADKAFFGRKDYQQYMVVKQMVADLNVPTEIVVCPIVRDSEGLAMSSRNTYLSNDDRQHALALIRTLNHVEKQIRDGERDGHLLMSEMRQMLIDGGVSGIDYAILADPATLKPYDRVELPVIALIAVHIGKTRLIDNALILAADEPSRAMNRK